MSGHYLQAHAYPRHSDEIDRKMHALEIYLQSCNKVPVFIKTREFEFRAILICYEIAKRVYP